MTMTPVEVELWDKAIQAAVDLYAHVIRNEIGEDPDHSAPEDAAEKLAKGVLWKGYEELINSDWQDLLK